MAYVRCDKDCNPKSVQPRNINVIDTFNNSNDFFHVDYEKKDKDNNVIPHRDPNVPQNTTYPTNPDVLFFDTNWTRRLSDNSAGVKRQYVQGPLYPGGIPFVVSPTDKYSSTQLLEPVYLATEGDDDLRIVDEANNDIFVISFTEPIVVDDEGGITGQLLINEEGDTEVTNELGNPIEL
jgi:hypothetical protein